MSGPGISLEPAGTRRTEFRNTGMPVHHPIHRLVKKGPAPPSDEMLLADGMRRWSVPELGLSGLTRRDPAIVAREHREHAMRFDHEPRARGFLMRLAQAGWSNADMASAIGCSASQVYNWRTARSMPDRPTAVALGELVARVLA